MHGTEIALILALTLILALALTQPQNHRMPGRIPGTELAQRKFSQF